MRFSTVVLLLVALPGIASASDAPVIAIGSRLRVSVSHEAKQLTGTVSALTDRELILRIGQSTRTVPLDSVESVAVSLGKRSRGRGALIGAGIGVAAGVIAGFSAGDDDPSDDALLVLKAGEKALFSGIALGLTGALIGALLPPGERWETTHLSGVRASCEPSLEGGVRMCVTFAY